MVTTKVLIIYSSVLGKEYTPSFSSQISSAVLTYLIFLFLLKNNEYSHALLPQGNCVEAGVQIYHYVAFF